MNFQKSDGEKDILGKSRSAGEVPQTDPLRKAKLIPWPQKLVYDGAPPSLEPREDQ